MAKIKGTFNKGWWNCFESFAAALLESPGNEGVCLEVLRGAGISRREAGAWLDKEEYHNPRVEALLRDYWLKV